MGIIIPYSWCCTNARQPQPEASPGLMHAPKEEDQDWSEKLMGFDHLTLDEEKEIFIHEKSTLFPRGQVPKNGEVLFIS